MKKAIQLVVFLQIINLGYILSNDLKGFDDNIYFTLNWKGSDTNLLDVPEDAESMSVVTHANEKYKCYLPKLAKKEDEAEEVIETSVLDYLEPIFKGNVCSYRIESYWTYEICHGNYIKQYHEERDGKSTKLQEYYLGKWNKDKTIDLRKKLEENKDEKLRYLKIDGINLAYFEVEMTDGTVCDLTNQPRITRVFYVCYAHGKNEIYSFKETSSCNYEIVVLTPALCLHPKYKLQETTENAINCIPLENAPKKPKSLLAMEVESMKLRYQKLMDVNKGLKDAIAVFKVDSKDGKLTMELVDEVNPKEMDIFEKMKIEEFDKTSNKPFSPTFSTSSGDTSIVESFLAGKTCLTGGTGWWKYEFCYGKYVKQFHIDKIGGTTSIIVGTFDEDAHKEYLITHPEKRPKPKSQRKQIIHFYSKGSLCDKTGKPRNVEVVLKCVENAQSSSAVSLYLVEPSTCNYVLGVESPLICNILDKVDEDGLVPKGSFSETGSADEDLEKYLFQN